MSVTQIKMKDWKAVCPKCSHIQHSEKDKNTFCANCSAPAIMTYGQSSNDEWTSDGARRSWRRLECSSGCGWHCNSATCSKCGTTIQGDYFQGSTKWCFVATACFVDENHPTVESLRNFRDEVLSGSNFGRQFIAFYYINGPKMANLVNRFSFLKKIIKPILNLMAHQIDKRTH